jgi:hypothetical protein
MRISDRRRLARPDSATAQIAFCHQHPDRDGRADLHHDEVPVVERRQPGRTRAADSNHVIALSWPLSQSIIDYAADVDPTHVGADPRRPNPREPQPT